MMMWNRMTVKELINELNKFDGDLIVNLQGGEGGSGEWAQLNVGTIVEKEYTDYKGRPYTRKEFEKIETIMDY